MLISAMLWLLVCIGHSVAWDVTTPAVATKGTASDISTIRMHRKKVIGLHSKTTTVYSKPHFNPPPQVRKRSA
jgi:hypothetical protein